MAGWEHCGRPSATRADGLIVCTVCGGWSRVGGSIRPAPAPRPFLDETYLDLEEVTGMDAVAHVLGTLQVTANLPALIVLLTEVEAGIRPRPPALGDMDVAGLRTFVEALLPATKAAIRLLDSERAPAPRPEEKPNGG